MKSHELLVTDLVNPEVIRDAHKFFIHTVVSEVFCQFGDELICRGLFKLPFDKVLFEFSGALHDRISRISMIGANFSDGNICVIPFIRYHDGTWSGGTDYHLELYPKEARWGHTVAYNDPRDKDWFDHQQFVADVVAATVALLGSTKCQISQVDAPYKLNKAREKRNRPPMFSYKVVTLNGESNPRNDLGGTHSSPALHWRRGHFRKLSDKVVPVSPCLVGSIDRGVVVKDYDATNLGVR